MLPTNNEVNTFVKSDYTKWNKLGEGIDKVCFEFDSNFVISFLRNNATEHFWTQLLIDSGLLIGQYYDIEDFLYVNENYSHFHSRGVYIVERLKVYEYFEDVDFSGIDEDLINLLEVLALKRLNVYRKQRINANPIVWKNLTFSDVVKLWNHYFPEYDQLITEHNLHRRWDFKINNIGFLPYNNFPVLFDLINL